MTSLQMDYMKAAETARANREQEELKRVQNEISEGQRLIAEYQAETARGNLLRQLSQTLYDNELTRAKTLTEQYNAALTQERAISEKLDRLLARANAGDQIAIEELEQYGADSDYANGFDKLLNEIFMPTRGILGTLGSGLSGLIQTFAK